VGISDSANFIAFACLRLGLKEPQSCFDTLFFRLSAKGDYFLSFGKRTYQGQPFLNRRRSPRRKCDVEAEILSPGLPPRSCRVVDISDSGARLELGSGFGIADVFELSAFGSIYPARIVRRGPRTLYIEFT